MVGREYDSNNPEDAIQKMYDEKDKKKKRGRLKGLGMYILGMYILGISSSIIISGVSRSIPEHFHPSRSDIPFSVNGTNWRGYVRCDDEEKNVFIKTGKKIVPLEEALSRIPKDLGQKDLAKKMVMDIVDDCYCSE